jgi:putative membrane protein
MKQVLSDYDRGQLNQRIAEAEKRTKAQIVLAVIKRCDTYAELPWKAFALGASIAGLSIFILDLLLKYWASHSMVLIAVAAPLAAGAALGLLTVFVPRFARLFLSVHRAEAEVRQYTESLFLARQLFATSQRTGILLLVSLFERKVVLLPDRGLRNKLTGDTMRDVIERMTPPLSRNEVARALEAGLERLSQVLETSAQGRPAGSGKNELPNAIIEEKGA